MNQAAGGYRLRANGEDMRQPPLAGPSAPGVSLALLECRVSVAREGCTQHELTLAHIGFLRHHGQGTVPAGGLEPVPSAL